MDKSKGMTLAMTDAGVKTFREMVKRYEVSPPLSLEFVVACVYHSMELARHKAPHSESDDSDGRLASDLTPKSGSVCSLTGGVGEQA
jgi:hypothetical protein